MKNQWFHPISWPGWTEEELLARVHPTTPSVPDHQPPTPVIYGPKGEVLAQRQQRPVGFRPPR